MLPKHLKCLMSFDSIPYLNKTGDFIWKRRLPWRAAIATSFVITFWSGRKYWILLYSLNLNCKILTPKVLQRNQPAGICSETALQKYPLLRGFCFYHWLCSCVWNLQGNLFSVPLWFGFLCKIAVDVTSIFRSSALFFMFPYLFLLSWMSLWIPLHLLLFLVSSHSSCVQNSSVWNSLLRALAWVEKVITAKMLTFFNAHRDFLWCCLYVLGGACLSEGSLQHCLPCVPCVDQPLARENQWFRQVFKCNSIVFNGYC